MIRGLQLHRFRAHAPVSSPLNSWETDISFPQHTERLTPDRVQEIISLSTDSVTIKSAEMTQQQKIAAALARARTSNSTSRLHESTAVATAPDPSEQETTPVPELHSAQLTPAPKFAGISQLLIWSGLALVVLSCYLLVTTR